MVKKKKNSKAKIDIQIARHSLSHVLMQALTRLYKAVPGVGPAIENGFYHDFDADYQIKEEDLPKIEKEMRKIIAENLSIEKKAMKIDEAIKFLEEKGYGYTAELAQELRDEEEKEISFYQQGEFINMCKGHHLVSTGEINPDGFKLTSVAGAYWRGDEKNKMLTRIYGTAFPSKKELDDYLKMLEEAKNRDHRKIGKELDLFSFHPAAPADVFWHHKGYILMKELLAYWREIHDREGYQEVRTPELLTKAIWQQSGHLDNYAERMYRVITPDAKKWNMAVKPMNCNGGMLIYKSRPRSYKEFPLRMGELGVVHRYEGSGETHGLLRVREFTQDDAHIYCTLDQVKSELKKVIKLCFEVYQTFGLKLDHLELSTRPENSVGSDEAWEKAEAIMKEVLKEGETPCQINEGDGAFYGPKFDFHLKDAIGRTWQCATIQLDFAQPENFDLEYITDKGTKERPVMIHRTLYGSVERFLGIVIENCTGAFPVWLAPAQVVVLPITEKHSDYAEKIEKELKDKEVRVEVDGSSQTLSYRIREAELQKVPYILVVGDKEEKNNSVNVRKRGEKKQEELKLSSFVTLILKKIKTRDLQA